MSTKSANRKLGWPRGRWYDKYEQAVGSPIAIGSGALLGYFLGKQKVTIKQYFVVGSKQIRPNLPHPELVR